jgi:hypothetical protein
MLVVFLKALNLSKCCETIAMQIMRVFSLQVFDQILYDGAKQLKDLIMDRIGAYGVNNLSTCRSES